MLPRYHREDLLYLPQAVAGISLLNIFLKQIFVRKASTHIASSQDSLLVFTFRLLRLLSVLALLALECFLWSIEHEPHAGHHQSLVYVSSPILHVTDALILP